MMKEKEKIQYIGSNEILELDQFHATQAKILISKLRPEKDKNVFIEIDCVPNGLLNPFSYGNGIESAKIIKDLAASYLGPERYWLEEKIKVASGTGFKTDYELGERVSLWKKIDSIDYKEKINWSEAFCIKNTNGLTKIWHPEWRRLRYSNNFSTRAEIINFVYEGNAYWQKFFMPLPAPNNNSAWRMHYKLVFLAEAADKSLEFIGGLWISRPGFKIYPDKKSIIGLISPLATTDCFY